LVFLLIAVVKPNPLPTVKSLAIASFMMFLIKLGYLGSNALDTCTMVLRGVLQSLVPTTIIGGAIYLFDAMESAGCLSWMCVQMKTITNGHPVAEVMLIGWAFAYVIEGASGFGTPAALAAPVLASLGHPKFECVACLLCMNTFATVFGAVGTPIWFGVGESTGASEAELVQIGMQAAMACGVAALLLVPMVVKIVVPWPDVKANLIFITASVLCTVIPAVTASAFMYEFPSLFGGLVGMICTAVLIKMGVGLRPCKEKDQQDVEEMTPCTQASIAELESQAADIESRPSVLGKQQMEAGSVVPSFHMDEPVKSSFSQQLMEAIMRTMPVWCTVLLLLVTRIEDLGLKGALTSSEPTLLELQVGTLGKFWVSSSLVIGVSDMLATGRHVQWSYMLLYVPCLLPFVFVGTLTLLAFRSELKTPMSQVAAGTLKRLSGPAVALIGALTLVELIRGADRDRAAPATLIGVNVASGLSYGFILFSAAIGALGSFFSGSTTISNLTFGAVQQIAAKTLGLHWPTMVALQVCGATMGNAVCLSNIIAACSVIGLQVSEGKVIKTTVPIVALFSLVSTLFLTPMLFAS
jgi:lactate permease